MIMMMMMMMIIDDDDDESLLWCQRNNHMFSYNYLLPSAAVAFFLQAVVNVDRDAGGSTWNAIVY